MLHLGISVECSAVFVKKKNAHFFRIVQVGTRNGIQRASKVSFAVKRVLLNPRLGANIGTRTTISLSFRVLLVPGK